MSSMFPENISIFFNSESILLKPFVSLENETTANEYTITQGNGSFSCSSSTEQYCDSLFVTEVENGFIVKRIFQNTSKELLTLRELGVCIDGIDFNLNPRDDFYYHVENPRLFQRMTITVDFDRLGKVWETEFDEKAGNKWVNAGDINERIGSSPCQPFPALLISNYGTTRGYVFGTLSQDMFYHSYTVKHKKDKILFNLYSSFKYID